MNDEQYNAPPPPQSLWRKIENQATGNINKTLPCDQIELAGFHAAQRRYILSQIWECNTLPQTKDPSQVQIKEAESLVFLDIVLNGSQDALGLSP